MTADTDALTRLGEYVERRIAELGLNYSAVCRAGGFSDETLSKIRKGTIRARHSTYHGLEQALLWERGSVDAILSGGEPTSLPAAASTTRETEGAQATGTLSPGEALRRVVRASAREFGVSGDSLDEVFQAVRQDLDEAPSARTDLSDRVRLRRAEMGMSLEAVAASTVNPDSGERLVEADWLDRLERAALRPTEYPEYPQLDALVAVLHLDAIQVRDDAGAQFMNVHTVWSEDGQTMGMAEGELSAEDSTKMQELTRLYGKAPQRRDG